MAYGVRVHQFEIWHCFSTTFQIFVFFPFPFLYVAVPTVPISRPLFDKKKMANRSFIFRASSSAPDAAAAVRNFLNSIQGQQGLSGQGGSGQGQSAQGKLFPMLNDLLEPPATIPMIDSASDAYVDNLLGFLPPTVLVLSQQGDNGDPVAADPSPESVTAAREAMSSGQKRSLLKKVLRSPQFSQSLASLTAALRDGGLPTVSEALGIRVENGGLVRGGSVPLGGGEAVEAFVEGVKRTVQNGK